MSFYFSLPGKWDHDHWTRDWLEMQRRSPNFATLRLKARETGDKKLLPIMADLCEEHGFNVMAMQFRTKALKLVKRRKRKGR